MPPSKIKQLLVEGIDDKHAVLGLIKHHVPWPGAQEQWPVFVDDVGSADEILDRGYMTTKLQESGLRILGVIVDADNEPKSRWQSICSLCEGTFPNMPTDLPSSGLILDSPSGLRFGFWLMPDCSSNGMLESFLRYLVPADAEPLLDHARDSFSTARTLGAACKDAHIDKAHIHTWLAWQDPPGQRLGIALTKKVLDPHAPFAAPFVKWFKDLYQV